MTITPSEHWHSLTGPANWYRVWHPPEWTATESEGIVRLEAPDGHAVLTVHAFWKADWHEQPLEDTIDLAALFPERRNVRPLKALDIPWPSLGFEGEANTGSLSATWWKRPFARREWRRWRLWVARHEAAAVVAVFLPGEPRDPEMETMATMILNTVAFAEQPADPPQVFADRVVELARERFPLLECRQGDEFQLQMGESTINLFNFYRAYVNSPDKFDEIVLPALTTVVQAQEWGREQTDPPLERVRDRVLPMLYPEAVWRENLPGFIASRWIADLMILYVVDESQAYWYIREELLETWGMSREELHALALRNLDAWFEEHPMEFTLAGDEEGPLILMPNRPDAYNTSRLLSESFHERLRELLGREFAVGVPGRDFFVAVNLFSAEVVSQVRRKVAEDYTRMDHPLTDRLLLVSTDGVSEWVEN